MSSGIQKKEHQQIEMSKEQLELTEQEQRVKQLRGWLSTPLECLLYRRPKSGFTDLTLSVRQSDQKELIYLHLQALKTDTDLQEVYIRYQDRYPEEVAYLLCFHTWFCSAPEMRSMSMQEFEAEAQERELIQKSEYTSDWKSLIHQFFTSSSEKQKTTLRLELIKRLYQDQSQWIEHQDWWSLIQKKDPLGIEDTCNSGQKTRSVFSRNRGKEAVDRYFETFDFSSYQLPSWLNHRLFPFLVALQHPLSLHALQVFCTYQQLQTQSPVMKEHGPTLILSPFNLLSVWMKHAGNASATSCFETSKAWYKWWRSNFQKRCHELDHKSTRSDREYKVSSENAQKNDQDPQKDSQETSLRDRDAVSSDQKKKVQQDSIWNTYQDQHQKRFTLYKLFTETKKETYKDYGNWLVLMDRIFILNQALKHLYRNWHSENYLDYFRALFGEHCDWVLKERFILSPPAFKDNMIEEIWESGLLSLYTHPQNEDIAVRDWIIPLQEYAPKYTVGTWEKFNTRRRKEFQGYLYAFIRTQPSTDAQEYKHVFSPLFSFKDQEID